MAQEGLQEGDYRVNFKIQNTASIARTVARGIEEIERLLPLANRVQRQPVPARRLTVGLQCGGSDGYSGIGAHPALGTSVDRLVRHGGTAILSETPRIYGSEHLLTRRAVSRAGADKLPAELTTILDIRCTTARGSVYGCAPTPSLKFSTHTALWLKRQEDVDPTAVASSKGRKPWTRWASLPSASCSTPPRAARRRARSTAARRTSSFPGSSAQ